MDTVDTKQNSHKKIYRKKNEFKFNIIFNSNGETLEKIIERAFENFCLKRN